MPIFAVVGVLVFTFFASYFLLPKIENSNYSAAAVYDWFQSLPMNSVFHYAIAILICGYLIFRLYEYGRICEDYKSSEQSEPESSEAGIMYRLTTRDCWTIQEMRKRALRFRMMADLALAGVIILLFGGIYASFFLVPQIRTVDKILSQERQHLLIFKERFGNRLKLIAEGQYWFKLNQIPEEIIESLKSPSWETVSPALRDWLLEKGLPENMLKLEKYRDWKSRKENEWLYEEISKSETLQKAGSLGKVEIRGGRNVMFVGSSMFSKEGEDWSIKKKFEEEYGIPFIIRMGVFDVNSGRGIVFGPLNSVFFKEEGKDWKSENLETYELLEKVIFDTEIKRGIAVGSEGTVFLIEEGKNWKSESLELKSKDDRVENVIFDAEAKRGIVVSKYGLVFSKEDKNDWKLQNLELKPDDYITDVIFDSENNRGMIFSLLGLIFFKEEQGEWELKINFELNRANRMYQIFIREDWKKQKNFFPIVFRTIQGTIFAVQSGNWESKKFPLIPVGPNQLVNVDFLASPNNKIFLVFAPPRTVFLLNEYPHLEELLTNQSMESIRAKIIIEPIIRESNIGKEMITFLDNLIASNDVVDDDNNLRTNTNQSEFEKFMGEFTLERLTIMIVLFYLVHVLVRIYQYNMRLSQFWTSRSDALLLAQSFTDKNMTSFDNLVGVLASDVHDFKSMPGLMHKSWLPRRRKPNDQNN